MTPEDVLAALAARAPAIDGRRPDPLVEAAREEKIGKRVPLNWRAVRDKEGKIDVAASWPSLRTALGSDARRVSKSGLHEVAADALVGMPERSWKVLQTAIGIDMQARDEVVEMLLREARRSRRRDKFWPDKLKRKQCRCGRAPASDYLPDLVELAVLQLEHPRRFSTHDARAVWFGISNSHWRSVMQQPFDAVSGPLWRWYDTGIGYICYRLSRRRRETA